MNEEPPRSPPSEDKHAPVKLAYSISEATTATGLSRATLYRYIARGELATFKVGSRTLIRADVLIGFVERLSASPS
jgi:excisionase family DNA binding protein